MNKLLLFALLCFSQLSFSAHEREIQNYNKAAMVGFMIASGGAGIAMHAVKELEKNPGNAFQQNLYDFGSTVTFIGAVVVGYSLGSKSRQVLRRKEHVE